MGSGTNTKAFPAEVRQIAAIGAWVRAELPPWVDAAMADIGVIEAVTNAIVHGTLGLDSTQRSGGVDAFLAAAGRAHHSGEIAISLRVAKSIVEVQLRWGRHRCPPQLQTHPALLARDLREHGRGMAMIYATCDRVVWRADGLGMTLHYTRPECPHNAPGNRTPNQPRISALRDPDEIP